MKTLTPFGVNDYIPQDAKKNQRFVDQIVATFQSFEFQMIRTPTIEYYDSLAAGLGPTLKEKSIKFFDPSGQLLLLRPDHTTPIARLVSSQLTHSPLPLRVYYVDPIFQQPQSHFQAMETHQAGLELIGQQGLDGDIEVIEICIQTFLSLGINTFCIDIGHIDFIRNLSPEKKQALLKKDYIAFGAIPSQGKIDVLDDFPQLQLLYTRLKEKGFEKYIRFNHGLVKDLSYYTGIIFDCYVEGVGNAVASGGRYDHLFKKFGFDAAAIGFAIDISALSEVTNHASQ